MPLGRALLKSLYSEVALTESRSYLPSGGGGGAGQVNSGSSFTSEDFNVQYAQFLQPAGVSVPGDAVRIGAGHVLYWAARYTAANAAVNILIQARTSPTGTFFNCAPNIPGVLLVTTVLASARIDQLGAMWEVRVVMANSGPDNATNCELAVAVRTR